MSVRPDLSATLEILKTVDPEVLKKIPALSPPPGQISRFDDPPSFMPSMIVAMSITAPIMLAAVALRIYSKIKIGRRFWWDDYTCFVAAAMSIVVGALSIYGTSAWYGKHEWDVSVYTLIIEKYHRLGYYFMVGYNLALLVVKLSLFFLYIRLFSTDRRTRILSWIGIVACLIGYLSFITWSLVSCTPLAGKSALASFITKKCDNIRSFHWISLIFNIVTDIYLLIIPIPVIVRLQMPKAKKTTIYVIFGFGVLGIIGGVLNGYYRAKLARTIDITYWIAPALLSDIVELNIGILVGCMPVIQPSIFRRIFRSLPLSPSLKQLFSRHSFGSRKSDGAPLRPEPQKSAKPYLETRILGDAHGQGKFMSAINDTEIGHEPKGGPQAETRMLTDGPGEQETSNDRSWFRRSFFAPWGGWRVSSANSSADINEKPAITGAGRQEQRPSLLSMKSITVTTETTTTTKTIRDGQDCQLDQQDDVGNMV